MKQIPLTQGKFAIVDDEDFIYLNRFNWCTINKRNKYIPSIPHTRIGGALVSMTDFLMGRKRVGFKNLVVFRNKDSLDCRKCNLYLESNSVSAHNMSKVRHFAGRPPTSKHKGIMFNKTGKAKGKWRARLQKEGKRFCMGDFDTEREAALAYNEKAKELYGEFAYQNKIEE